MRDWLIIGHYADFRLSEWIQEQKLVNKGRFAINDPAERGDGSAKALALEHFIFVVPSFTYLHSFFASSTMKINASLLNLLGFKV
eukprot:3733889-Ditylum_brightwellii.AAC.1